MEVFKFCIATFPTFLLIAILVQLTQYVTSQNFEQFYVTFYTIGGFLLIIAVISGFMEKGNKHKKED